MLTRIVHNSPKLCTFFDLLNLELSKPQRQHMLNLADALLVCEDEKTLAALQRQFIQAPDVSNIADFLRISPWKAEDIRTALRRNQVPRGPYLRKYPYGQPGNLNAIKHGFFAHSLREEDSQNLHELTIAAMDEEIMALALRRITGKNIVIPPEDLPRPVESDKDQPAGSKKPDEAPTK